MTALRAIQERYTLRPLSQFLGHNASAAPEEPVWPVWREEDLNSVEPTSLKPEVRQAMEQGIADARARPEDAKKDTAGSRHWFGTPASCPGVTADAHSHATATPSATHTRPRPRRRRRPDPVRPAGPAGRPAQAANWLPAPGGPFTLAIRVYGHDPSVLDGSWTLPTLPVAKESKGSGSG